MNSISKQHASMLDDIEQVAAMTPNLSLEELNIVAEQKMKAANERPHPDFCGLSPTQIPIAKEIFCATLSNENS